MTPDECPYCGEEITMLPTHLADCDVVAENDSGE
jgi:hypothetical protein